MNIFRYLLNPKLLVSAAFIVAVGLIGFNLINQSAATAASCVSNDVIKCGYTTPTDLANKVQADSQLQALYNHDFTPGYGIGDLNYWKANAKHATVYKDGRVVLDDGTVVATGAYSLGREKINSNRTSIKIGNTTWWYGLTTDNFAGNSIPAYVLLNPDDHSLQFAALTACANPIWGNSSAYKCSALTKEKVSDTTYKFSATTYAKNANLTKLVYDFGDGTSQTITSNFDQKVSHTYAPGTFTAKVTAYFNVNGKEKSDTRAECTKPVEVPQPPKSVFVCDSLTPTQISRTKYSFTVKGKSEHATFMSAKFDFGDNQTATNLTGSNETVTTEHNYAKEGDYTVKAYLTYKEGTTAETAKCKVKVTINQETCADKPNAPECQPPKTCADTPNAPECQPPKTCADTPDAAHCKELPSTGPAEIIASALGIGSIAGAGMYYRSSRRNLADRLLNR